MISYQIAPNVAWVDDEVVPRAAGPLPRVYVAKVPDGRPIVLEGSAWAIWSAVAQEGAPARITTLAATFLGQSVTSELEAEVRSFLDALVEHCLLQRRG